ncbi:hypothetical protein GCM10028804_05130 [Larkinella terrae]
MTIRYFDRAKIDPVRWDDCVCASAQRLIYAFSWYLDALTTGTGAPNWGGIVAEDHGKYQAVMPVVYKKKFGICYVIQPDYCQQLGIFSRVDVELPSLSAAFFHQLARRFKWVVSYRFNEKNETELEFPTGFSVTKRLNHVLELNKPYEELFRNFATDRKINLNRARHADWLVEEKPDIRPLIQLHRQHNEAKVVGGMKLDLTIYERFARAVDALQNRGLARIWLARKLDGETAEAGGLFVLDRDRIIYLFNGASVSGRKQQARLWMINRLIEEFAGQPMVFDFESPAVGAESVKAYYRSFGAENRPYTEISYNNLPWLITSVRRFGRIVTLLLKKTQVVSQAGVVF